METSKILKKKRETNGMVKLVARLGGLFMALMTALGAGTGAMAECAHAAPDWTPLMLLDKMIKDDGNAAFAVSRGDTRTSLLAFHENTFAQMILGARKSRG